MKAIVAFVIALALFQACKKSDSTVVVPLNTTSLKARLDSANTLYTNSKEGVAIGSFEVGSRAVYKSAIDAALAVLNSASSTQTQINNAYVNLGQALGTYQTKMVSEIAPDKLVLLLHLDGNVRDASGKGNNGTIVPGATGIIGSTTVTGPTAFTGWGGGTLVATADRLGQAGNAYMFDKGAHIEIPYNASLNPSKEITIAMWVKPTKNRADNYLVSLNRWNGYKLQLESSNKVFMTVKGGAGVYNDHDNASPVLDLNTWYHVAVTYKAGEMVFYLNGKQVKTWTDVKGDPFPVKSSIGMSIGQDLPNAVYTNNEKDDADGNNLYANYGGYFTGAMDEIRIYNVVLTGTQVTSIYNAEKSL